LSSRRIVLALTVLMLFLPLYTRMEVAMAGSATVKRLVICTGIDKSKPSWEPIGAGDKFSTAEAMLYSFVELADVAPPIDLRNEWIFSDGSRWKDDPIKITWSGGGQAYFRRKLEGSVIQVGVYKVELYGDSILLSTVQFTLQPAVEFVSKTFSPKEGTAMFPGDTVIATYELKNTGKSILKAVRFAIKTLPNDVTLVEAAAAKNLEPGATDKFALKIKFDKEGEYELRVQLIMNEVLIEEGPLTVKVSLKPVYLVIQRITTQPSTSEPFYVGDVGTITYTVKNTGQTVGRNVEIKVVSVPPEIEVVQVTAPKDLQPGATDEWQVKLRAKSPGNYEAYLTFYVDGKKVIFEAEGKTIEQWKIPIVATEKPFTQTLGALVLLGLVFVAGIVVAVLVMRRRRRVAPSISPPVQVTAIPTAAQPSPTPEQRFCISCGSSIPLATRFCPKCGAEQQR